MKKKKIIIIGAGPAGITAGLELLRKCDKYNVIILEETNDIGGISKTINYKGNKMDIGGHRFFSKDSRVMLFWNSILPEQGYPSYDDKILGRKKSLSLNGPDPEEENKVMLIRNRISRIYYLNKFFDYPVSMKLQTFKNLGMINTIEGGFSYLKSSIFKRKETSLENFYINRFGKKLYSMFFEKYTEKLWGRHPSQISADWGAQRVKGLSISKVIGEMFKKKLNVKSKQVETSLIEEFHYPKYGPGQLWETAIQEFQNRGGIFLKKHKVVKINRNGGKITSVDCNHNGDTINIKGDLFISSMSIKDLFLSLNGDIPKEVYESAINLPYRDFVTVGLLLKKINLKNETQIKTLGNIVPDCWIYVQDANVKLGRIQIFNNWSPYMVKDVENTIWIGLEYFCNENDDFWNMSDKECIDFAVNELIKMNIIDKDYVIDSHIEKIMKAYPAYFDTYKNIDKIKEYLNKIDNLYCIGRNGQHRYNNMDHSMITAFEVVNNIIDGKKSKENIWNVNTDMEYHEIKKN